MSDSVMVMLRDGTAELHARAEQQPFQRALVTGRIGKDDYRNYLAQMWRVHAALESAVDSYPEASRVLDGSERQEENLRVDLAYLGEIPAELPATSRLIERVRAAAGGPAALGHLYVLEGSKNGNAFVAKAVRKALGLLPGSGDRYLDPHGDVQRGVWADFKARMDAVSWTPEQREAMLTGAREMFAGVAEIAADLEAARAGGAGAKEAPPLMPIIPDRKAVPRS